MVFGMSFLEQWNRKNPGLMDLNMLLTQRAGMNSRWAKNQPHPTDRQLAIYIAHHYRSVVTNEASWSSAFALAMIKGEAEVCRTERGRKSVATEKEIADAEAVLK
jgi:hypothetical protein